MDENKKINEFEEYIKEEMDMEEIPESLKPENMRKRLEKAGGNSKEIKRIRTWSAVLATAACLVVLVTLTIKMGNWQNREIAPEVITTTPASDVEENEEYVNLVENEEIYSMIYDAMADNWPKEMDVYDYTTDESMDYVSGKGSDDGAAVVENTTASSAQTNSLKTNDVELESVTEDSATSGTGSALRGDYAGTNVQVEFVDEGDIVKNDGRYLYQLLRDDDDYEYKAIQIVDTENGLKEVSKIEDFAGISEFYIWEDRAVIIERLWAENAEAMQTYYSNEEICYDIAYRGNSYSNIHIYDISDRTKPEEIHTFTLKGDYKTSRISEGYLYFFSGYSSRRPEDKEDLEAYIPVIDGELLTTQSLYLPEESDATDYLVMTSVDLSAPTEFTDVMAAVTWGNYYYVSEKNIYVLDTKGVDYEGGSKYDCDKTGIVKFSYEKGQIEPVAEGIVDGMILDQFAMNEHNGYFRVITTVNAYEKEEVFDDITGESLGYNIEYLSDSNSVFVLDEKLNVTGSIKDLAEDERVYSARFMGDIGYFVTFRQVDPLFSVDFSDPTNPKILGELKISGFSEYLHFYGDNLLLGIGYEADEDTGRTEGIKLSMFDVSDPSNVKETNKIVLDKYGNSDAFYNHHAVLISTRKNLIGFMASGYGRDYFRDYMVYSYDSESGFGEKFSIDCTPDKYNGYDTRGTYIGDTFYLLMQNGGIKAYDINSGEVIDELKIEE